MQRNRMVVLVGAMALVVGATTFTRVLRPTGAGTHYPSDPRHLYAAVSQYLNEADVKPRDYRLVGLIAPSSGLQFCGSVAGHAYKLLKPGQYDRVIVICPSHYAEFRGFSSASVQYYRTPFGDVPVDEPAVRKLCHSSLFSQRSVVYRQDLYARGSRVGLHEREHGIEVTLPFLQLQLGEFRLVPIVAGELQIAESGLDEKAVDSAVSTLRRVVTDRTLVVVSGNLTRVGLRYGYAPFRDNVAENVERLDAEALELIMNRDYSGFQEYIERTGNDLPARLPISVLMKLLPSRARGVLLDYDSLARRTTDATSSVSYAAVAFYDLARGPAEQRPVRTLLSSPDPDGGAGNAGPAGEPIREEE